MSVRAAPLGLRLFLEGVEVPVISASVVVQPDTPASASIQIIPTDMALNFLPRTLVHLFYLDGYLSQDELVAAKSILSPETQARPSNISESGLNRFEASDFAYKLLFSGEVIGLNFQKNPNGRQLVLQCLDLSSYWDTCYQFFSDYSTNGSGLTDKHHNFVGAGEGLFDNFGGTQWVTSRLINTKPRSPQYQDTEGLLGGLIHLLEAVGGIKYRTSKFKGFKGINDFFTIAELRYNLLGMLGAVAEDKTSAKLYASKAFNKWLMNGMTSLGNLVSFRDLLNHVNRYIFHNIYPNPCAYYKKGDKEKTAKVEVKTLGSAYTDVAAGGPIQRDMKRALSQMGRASNMYAKVVQPPLGSTINSLNSEYFAAQRIIQDTQDLMDSILEAVNGLTTDDKTSLSTSLKEVKKDLDDAVDASVTRTGEGVGSGTGSEAVGGGADIYGHQAALNREKRAKEVYDLLVKSGKNLYSALTKGRIRKNTIKKVKIPAEAHLFNQLFLPECFFVAPPRCNVLFPDQYYSVSYSRNFMRECSRLALQGGIGMTGGRRGAKIFSRFYLAPNIRDVRGEVLQASLSQASKIILQHEVHSGIIPKFEWVTDGHRWGVKAAIGVGKLQDVKKTQKIHYLQRLAEFQFYLHRWSARTLSVDGIFNPNIVAGFPAAILDRAAPSPEVQAVLTKTLRRQMLPTQYLGKVYTYTHSIHQGGGSTNIQFAYARTHRGLDDEFLGVLTKEIKEEYGKKDVSVAVKELATKARSLQAEIDAREESIKQQREERNKEPAGVPEPPSERENKAKKQQDQKDKAALRKLGKYDRKLQIYKTIVRMYAEDKLKANIRVANLGKIKKVQTTGEVLLHKFDCEDIGISEEILEQKGIVMTAAEAGMGERELRRQGKPYGALYSATKAIKMPELIKLTVVQERGTGQFERNTTAFEDAVRPGWFAPEVWTNDAITKKVYEPLLGTVAITDDKSIGAKQQEEMMRNWADSQKKSINMSAVTIEAETETDPGGTAQGEGTASVQSVDNKFFYSVVEGSVEETIDGLSLVYGMIKEKGGDVHEFIREYTSRPIANIVDILGSQNLEFNAIGEVADPDNMIEGFHSRAYGDYNTDVQLPERAGYPHVAGYKAGADLMAGEADPTSVTRPSIIGKTHDETAFRSELDPRGRARGRVVAYMEELNVSRGLLSQ